MQKRLNRSIYGLLYGRGWAQAAMCQTEVQIPTREEAILRGKRSWPRTCPAIDIFEVTQQGAALARCGCPLVYTRWGAHWLNLANTSEPSVCRGNAALCQTTLITCSGMKLTNTRWVLQWSSTACKVPPGVNAIPPLPQSASCVTSNSVDQASYSPVYTIQSGCISCKRGISVSRKRLLSNWSGLSPKRLHTH